MYFNVTRIRFILLQADLVQCSEGAFELNGIKKIGFMGGDKGQREAQLHVYL